jgi:hypothetical protein
MSVLWSSKKFSTAEKLDNHQVLKELQFDWG